MKQKLLLICTAAFLIASCGNEKTEGESTTKDSSGKETKMESTDKMEGKMEEKKSDNTYTMPDSAKMMADWQAYATPGEAHKMLAKSSGTWTANVTYWERPGGPAQSITATTVNKMVMDGKYQVSTTKGSMMGMPFEGMSTVAYDNAKKHIITTWIDNMGTGMMILEGPWNDATHSANLTGKAYDIAAGKDLDYRETFTVVDDKTQTMEMFKPAPDGKEFKCMEIKYTKK